MTGLDEESFRLLNEVGSNVILDAAMMAFTILGLTYVLALGSVVVWARGYRELAFDSLVLLLISTVVVDLMKIVIARERPYEVLENVHLSSVSWFASASSYSLPSGHAAKAFAVATLVLLDQPRRIGILATVGAGAVSVSRVYLGLHWPSDVVVGALIGAALAVVFYIVTRRSSVYRRTRKSAISLVGRIADRLRRRTAQQ